MTITPLLPVYNRAEPVFTHGEGAWIVADDGRRFLDCVAGIATNALGHAHPRLVDALSRQAGKLWHISNIFRIPGQDSLAAKLIDASFADTVFFANSGTEAIECALKMARKYQAAKGRAERIDIIGFAGSFHGRSYAAVNASGNTTYLDGFGPHLPGYIQLSIDDMPALLAAIAAPTTAAVIVEPVQGEGGARALTGEWLATVRRACTDAGVLLIYDEVQSGMGRTGKLFAHQWFDDATPDIMAIAKALGGGFPVGACAASEEAASGMGVSAHGSTFGGNPLAMAVANEAFDLIAAPGFLDRTVEVAARLRAGLEGLAARYPRLIVDVRGKGMLIGVKLTGNNREFMAMAREKLLLVAGGGDNCVRLLPPLNLSEAEADEAVARFAATLDLAGERWDRQAA
ncbi:MAG: acetylornithine transaminase [Sphingomonas sp. SCN 67-18]|nr:aspartate aminotransferase family protein [Sphingomonas sp. SCN 67-18]ODU22313.1 MAG: acetylornithine transaminase [Sphingomonas sp. SCN 67-18]